MEPVSECRSVEMKQEIFYEPIKTWLTSKGLRAFVTGQRANFVIPVSDLVPAIYKIPDLVGLTENGRVVIVEVEKNKKHFFDALGRCMLWKCIATFVYLAYPKGECPRTGILNRLGIGLLEVDCDSCTIDERVSLPGEGPKILRLFELHPLDFAKEQQLASRIRGTFC